MNKACPYCHVDDFSWFELFQLSRSQSECRNCGKPVRNSRLSTVLVILTVLGAFVVGALVSALEPNWLHPLGWLLTVVLVLVALTALPKPTKVEQPGASRLSPFAPDLRNDKVVLISGWNEDELHKIVDNFDQGKEPDEPPYEVEIQKQNENLYRLTFPRDVHPTVFAYLLNDLAYPMEFDLTGHRIVVAGKSTLSSAFEGIAASCFGRMAIIYLPENDADYDVVYMRTESGVAFAFSFNETVWQPVKDARLSNEVEILAQRF
jgi:hypothetical protein